ncbi:MAG: hypothetical protein JRM82_00780 [Nitrososphaerota archaeon]|nr:hypothetical protein [Nitrososphaerota archaeon]
MSAGAAQPEEEKGTGLNRAVPAERGWFRGAPSREGARGCVVDPAYRLSITSRFPSILAVSSSRGLKGKALSLTSSAGREMQRAKPNQGQQLTS